MSATISLPFRPFLALAAGLLAACLVPWRAFAQAPAPALDDNAAGNYFILAFPDTTGNILPSRFPNTRVTGESSLWIYSAVKNKVKIAVNGGAPAVLTLDPGKFKIHNVTGGALFSEINIPLVRTVTIEADHPVVVYCYFASIQGVEAWTPIPVEFWGTRYHAAAVPGETVKDLTSAGASGPTGRKKPAPAEIAIIAAYDNTHVTITPPPGVSLAGDPPRTITLRAKQVFQVQSVVDTALDEAQQDIAATIIQADKPIGVISGNTRVKVLREPQGMLDNAYKNMMIEWLAPVEQHGREFVFMPTYDNHRPGIGSAAERPREQVRIYNTSGSKLSGHHLVQGGMDRVEFTMQRDTLLEFVFGAPLATYFRTDTPAQAMMHSSAIVKFNGSTPCPGAPCQSYSAWAPYMVELTPREQWTSFAPYYAPVNPGGMVHYINVVTDTLSMMKIYRENNSTFLFNRRIPGTDLIWGSMSVSQGEDHWLIGKDGARFAAFVYGTMEGGEEFRTPDFEEYNAVSYGYPLAPGRRVLKSPDSLRIDTVMDCSELRITIRAVDPDPAGLHSVTLEDASVQNAKLQAVDPQRLSDIAGRSVVTVRVLPIDNRDTAEATVVIKDRTGKIWRIPYRYLPERVAFDPGTLVDFNQVNIGEQKDTVITITNPMDHPVEIRDIQARSRWGENGEDYAVEETTPALPVTLAPGGTMTARVSAKPGEGSQLRPGMLEVHFGCTITTLDLITKLAVPIVTTTDLNFGRFTLGVDGPKTLPMRICNTGNGSVTFSNPNDSGAGALIQWSDVPGFSIAAAELEKLRGAKLLAGECIDIRVTFMPTRKGIFETTARIWGNVRLQRDTSNWNAVVDDVAGMDGERVGEGIRGIAVTGPDRGSGIAQLRFTLPAREHVRLEIFDASGELVSAVIDGAADAGTTMVHWSSAGAPSGVYYCRIVAGGWARTVPLVVLR